MARSTARKRALNTLYEADEKGQEILSLLAERIEHPGAQTPLPDYAIDIIRGVDAHLRTIDHALNEYSPSWKVRRMAVVDRNILRMATWEMLYNDEVPDKVAIDEAISLSKTLSDAESPSFIHGLLSAVDDHRDDIHEIIVEVVAPADDEQNGDAPESDAAVSGTSQDTQSPEGRASDVDLADLQIPVHAELGEAHSDAAEAEQAEAEQAGAEPTGAEPTDAETDTAETAPAESELSAADTVHEDSAAPDSAAPNSAIAPDVVSQRDEAHSGDDSELKSEQDRVPEEDVPEPSESVENTVNDGESIHEETVESKHSQG